ncbi:DASH family cryptochrome [Undibacterium sp. SXout7W]|uniref:DASH family cryptochrome n=1 Tax=Undibacterium sp. SXout7W TaxID=3413049 RepID=UPI003BF08B59
MSTSMPSSTLDIKESTSTSPTIIYWFRHDLRLNDHPALTQVCQQANRLLFVYCHPTYRQEITRWNIPRTSQHRQQFLASTLADLSTQLRLANSELLQIEGNPADVLPALAQETNAISIYCEEIAAPEEQAEVNALRATGLMVHTVWLSSMLDPANLPFEVNALPDVFTHFRHLVERHHTQPPPPLPIPKNIPPLPESYAAIAKKWSKAPEITSSQSACNAEQMSHQIADSIRISIDDRSSFPHFLPEFSGGASAASKHLQQYFFRQLASTYKLTRNDLTGRDYSTKFSPWLASGALSARTAYAALKEYENVYGANDSTYWIWFELLWRDYFRLLHLKYGRQLYSSRGLTNSPEPMHDTHRFDAWCQAKTGESLVDAGMTELAATGYLSNRLRQIGASYLIHDLGCDWRAGAAWFESQLIDYDVYSNQGNWLYLSGRGTDPRNGRRFDPQKQAHEHDRDGTYQRLWGTL